MHQTVLIVEDEALSALTLQQILKHWGYTNCRSVASGEKALEYIRDEPVALLLVDVSLNGDMNGFEVIEKAREIRHAEYVLMTGYDPALLKEAIAGSQALACLTKPLDLDRLHHIIASVFDEKEESA